MCNVHAIDYTLCNMCLQQWAHRVYNIQYVHCTICAIFAICAQWGDPSVDHVCNVQYVHCTIFAICALCSYTTMSWPICWSDSANRHRRCCQCSPFPRITLKATLCYMAILCYTLQYFATWQYRSRSKLHFGALNYTAIQIALKATLLATLYFHPTYHTTYSIWITQPLHYYLGVLH